MNSESNKIRALEDKYGLPLFGMALTHLVDVGVRHLTEENVLWRAAVMLCRGL